MCTYIQLLMSELVLYISTCKILCYVKVYNKLTGKYTTTYKLFYLKIKFIIIAYILVTNMNVGIK